MTHKIKSVIRELNEKFGTLDPVEICKAQGIVLLYTDLPKQTRGFYMSTSMGSAIVVNDSLKGAERTACIAHELGHATLHEGLNYMFMNASTQMVTGRYENEANRFAALLVLMNSEIYSGATVCQISKSFSLPHDAVEWAISQIKEG